jgi:ABC-type cobalamin/Fe3+-siderophores transport system ATPase subunit
VTLKRQRFALTGTPGVGKSAFLFYMLWRLARTQENEMIILHRACDAKQIFVFTKGDCYSTTGLHTIQHMLYEPTTWYLTDTLSPPPGQYLATTILVASPDRRHYSEFLKHTLGVHLHYLPVWTLDELLILAPKYSLSKAVVLERFRMIGGIPRFIQSEWDLKTIIDDALSRVNIQRLSHNTCQELYSERDMCHTIVHLHLVEVEGESVSYTYTRAFPRMASQYVTERALKKFIKSEPQELTDFFKQVHPNI